MAKDKTDLTDDELAFVSGTPSNKPAYGVYLGNETFINKGCNKMLPKADAVGGTCP